MSLALMILLAVLVAAAWMAMGGLVASLWDDGIDLFAKQHRKNASSSN